MRIISLVLISFLIIFTINANEEKIKVPKDFKQLQEKLNEVKKSTTANVSDGLDWLYKIRPFIVPILIVLYLISISTNAVKSKPRRKKDNQSEIDEFIEKSNEKENEFVENNEISNLTIKVEEQTSLENNIQSYYVMAFGLLNFSKEQIEFSKKENEEAKFTCYVFDITDEGEEIPIQGLIDPFKDENNLLSDRRNMKVGLNFAYNDWTPMFIFPKSYLIPPYRGNRKIKFVVSSSKLNAKFVDGKIKNKKDLYFNIDTIYELNFEEPGYLEAEKYESDINEKIVQLGMAIAYSEKKINTAGVEAIKNWINSEVIWKNYFTDNTEDKIKYSFLLKNTYELLKNNKLSLSEIVKEINYKSNVSKKYEAMNLLLNIAGSDDRLSAAEDKLLNNTARALELDLERFQQMKTSTIANIDTVDEENEVNEETIFNFTEEMSNEDKCKKLRQEYTRWNRQTNNSNEKIRNQARKMVELTANLRKKYNC